MRRAIPLLLTMLLPAANVFADDWPLSRGNAQGTGVADAPLADAYEHAWTYTTQDAVKSSPVVVAGVVYVGSNDRHVHAIDLATGEARWKQPVGSEVEAPPMLDGGLLYVGTYAGLMLALDPADGAEKWRFDTANQILDSATPTMIGDRAVVLFGSYDNRLHCLDAKTGEPVWSFETEGYVHGSPAVDGEQVIFGGCDGNVYVLNLADGALLGRTAIQGQMSRMPAVVDGYAILGHYQNAVVSVDLEAHDTDWEFRDREFPYVSAAAVSGDTVVIGSRGRRVYALDRTTGEKQWDHRPRGAVDSSPVISGGRVVFGGNDGRLTILNLADGAEVWAYDAGGAVSTSPAVVDGYLVVGVEDGTVQAFKAKVEVNAGGGDE